MPRKRQKISKNVIGNVQTVVVKVGDTLRKRKRAPRKPRRKPDSSYDVPMRALPPVVYQIPQMGGDMSIPALFRPAPIQPDISIKTPVKTIQPILEDIGQRGTEGRVEILDLPTRKETMEELITPVSSMENETPIQPPIMVSQKPRSSMFSDAIPSPFQLPKATPLLPTSTVDFGVEKVYDDPERESGNITPSIYTGGILPVKLAKGSWAYWLNEYEQLTGTPFDKKSTTKLKDFKALVTKMKSVA